MRPEDKGNYTFTLTAYETVLMLASVSMAADKLSNESVHRAATVALRDKLVSAAKAMKVTL